MNAQMTSKSNDSVALFVTCLVDMFRASVGFASLRLLRQAGVAPQAPTAQTCCGQPAFNQGDQRTARAIARRVIDAFEPFTQVVVPSGSCGGMLRVHYPALLADDARWASRAQRFAAKVWELSEWLRAHDAALDVALPSCAAYHHSCSAQREMQVFDQPLELLAQVRDLDIKPLDAPQACCGFGGAFCVKYPDISNRLVSDKLDDVARQHVEYLVGGDLGCLLNIAGRASRLGMPIKVMHYAEILAGMADEPGIAQSGPAA